MNVPVHPLKAALTIAGSDPSGGAGIQVDLKTFTCIGVYGMAVITALTAQNAGRVAGTWPVDPGVVRSQLEMVLDDISPAAVKTGMLATSGIIRECADILQADIPLVIDPVMVSTSGFRLLDEDAIDSLIRDLFPLSRVVTPNLPEACILTGRDSIRSEMVAEVADEIRRMGPEYVIIKGGHGSGTESVDLLISRDITLSIPGQRYPYDVHGSGCCFSSALTGFLSHGSDVPAAFRQAKEFISSSLNVSVMGKSGKMMMNPSLMR